MTLSDIERGAIEAGYGEFTRLRKDDATTWRECFEGGRLAYERALCRPIEEAPKDGTPILARHLKHGWLSVQFVTEDGNDWIKTTAALCGYPLCFTIGSFDFFVPLPKPEGV